MILALNYGDLSNTISETNKLANELGQYCDNLSRKVQQKMYSVEGGMSSALSSADYYVNTKIKQLRTREGNARTLSSRTQILLDTAKRVDSDVENTINANQKAFFKRYPKLKPSKLQHTWISFMCDMKKVPVIGWLIKGKEELDSAIDQLKKDIKHWWKCDGGRELIMNCLDIVVKIGLAIAAVVTAVTAVTALIFATVVTGGAVLFAVAACVAAVIAVVNAAVNVSTSVQAIVASNSGDPAMSKIYSKRDTLAQVLREENFHNRFLNKLSNVGAIILELAEAFTGVILLIQSLGKIAGSFLSKNGVGFAFKELALGKDGKLTKKVTLNSIWKGTKSMFLNKKLTSSTSAGLRTTLMTNIKQSISYQANLFKLAIRNPKGYLTTKKIGDLGFFKNISEKIKYGSWQLKNTAFQFKTGSTLYNLNKIDTIVDTFNDSLRNVKLVFDGMDRAEGKGLIRRVSEKYIQNTLFDNDFVKIIDKTGIGDAIMGFDKSETAKDLTGIDKGIIQKFSEIEKSFENPYPSFSTLFPHFEYVKDGVYAY